MSKLIALVSGGKDSCFNMMHCVANGHSIVALANLHPPASSTKDELDSYCFQTVAHEALDLYSECMGVPLFRRALKEGGSICTTLNYEETKSDETEELYELLKEIIMKMPGKIDGVSVGAILSDYQRLRVEHVCNRLGLKVYAYLWRQDQESLMQSMIDNNLCAILVKVAALGLEKKHLGKTLQEMQAHLHHLNGLYQVNICGEGGEYETLTLDCPLFLKKIVIDESKVIVHSDDAFAPVCYLKLEKMHLEEKPIQIPLSTSLAENFLFTNTRQFCPDINQDRMELYHVPVICWNGGNIDLGEEIIWCFQQLEETLSSKNISLKQVVRVVLSVRDMNDFSRINEIYGKYFTINPPARVCVQVDMTQSVQLECLATFNHSNRECLHVQSISYWAPANIGPYSQLVEVNGILFLAGLIAMEPANLIIDPSLDAFQQTKLAKRHADAIVSAWTGYDCEDKTLGCICYCTSASDVAECERECVDLKCPYQVIILPRLPRDAKSELQLIVSRSEITDYKTEITPEYKIQTAKAPNRLMFGIIEFHQKKPIPELFNEFLAITRDKCYINSTQDMISVKVYCPKSWPQGNQGNMSLKDQNFALMITNNENMIITFLVNLP